MTAKLREDQFDYLNHNLFEDQAALISKFRVIKTSKFVFIDIDDDTAIHIRDWASDELQRKGFGINYELTPEGKILAELIDLLAAPHIDDVLPMGG